MTDQFVFPCSFSRFLFLLTILFSPSLSFLSSPTSFGSVFLNISRLKNNRITRKKNDQLSKLKLLSEGNSWGIFRHERNPIFPDDVESITIAIWEAIMATLYARERTNPSIIHNALSKTPYNNAPIRRDADRGRIGVEIEGVKKLFDSSGITDAKAIRHISLRVAARLSRGPWEGYEESTREFNRPVAVYLNTVKQTLIACEELASLKLNDASKNAKKISYDSIIVQTLGQNPEIPQELRGHQKSSKKDLREGRVDPKRGMIVLVQPTDFNSEFLPPGPLVDSVSNLQQLIARASVESIPVIAISPRFLVQQISESDNWSHTGMQLSSDYGGSEPPCAPTPWILRDFIPPAFAWIGSAVSFSQKDILKGSRDSDLYYFSRVSMMKSVLNEGQSWNIFGVKEYNDKQTHQYLASTNAAAGRPTVEVVKSIFNEWAC